MHYFGDISEKNDNVVHSVVGNAVLSFMIMIENHVPVSIG